MSQIQLNSEEEKKKGFKKPTKQKTTEWLTKTKYLIISFKIGNKHYQAKYDAGLK